MLETYISNVANVGRSAICVGSGNNGNDRIHTAGRLQQGQSEIVEMSIGAYETTLNLQLWKAYADEIEIFLETPSGENLPVLSERIGTQRYRAGETELLVYYGKPGPFQVTQEIYVDFLPMEIYLTSGIWKIHLQGRRIREGNYNLWLPGGKVLNAVTGFYRPVAAETLTIPSTAAKVITVGAYDSRLNAFADFSGRGGGNLFYPQTGSGRAGGRHPCTVGWRRLHRSDGNIFCDAVCGRGGSIDEGMGNCKRKRSFSLGRKSEGISPPRCPAPARV